MRDMGPLLELLRLAQAEGVLEGERLEAFAKGLQERAALVLDERLTRAEAEVQRLAEEAAWLRETNEGQAATIQGLERELAWRRETLAAREATIEGLERETAWRRESVAALQSELGALRAARDAASEAHDRLLAHHRDVLARAADELMAAAALPWYSLRTARRRLARLAATLRGESA